MICSSVFCWKFYFRFRFEEFVNKINHSLLTNKQFQNKGLLNHSLLTNKQFQFFFFFIEDWLNKSNGVYITKVGQPTSRPESVGLSIVNSSLQSQLGKGPGRCSHTMVETSNCSMGAPAYNPRPKPDVIISLHIKIQLWFSFYNAVCFTLWIIRLLRLQRA